MNQTSGHHAYQASAIETASPEQLTLMCYDGALRFIRRARVAAERDDLGRLSESVGRAQAVINELNVTLNMEDGGEIARNLREIYLFVNRHLSVCAMRKDVDGFDRAISMIGGLRDAWAQSMQLEPRGEHAA